MPNSKGPLSGNRNKLTNHPRERGTSPPQRAIQQFETGDKVHLVLDPSVREGRFLPRYSGRTGEIAGTQGAAYQVQINDGGKEKTIVTVAAHLRRQS